MSFTIAHHNLKMINEWENSPNEAAKPTLFLVDDKLTLQKDLPYSLASLGWGSGYEECNSDKIEEVKAKSISIIKEDAVMARLFEQQQKLIERQKEVIGQCMSRLKQVSKK